MILLVLSGNMVFFPENVILFFGRKMKDDLSQEILANLTFSVYMYKWYKYDIARPSKKSKMIFSKERVLVVLCNCMETCRGIFIYCFPVEKARKFDFFLNLFGWRYSTMKNLQYSVPFSPQELYLEV